MKQKIKENMYWLLGQFFIWIIPLVMLMILAIDTKTTKASIKLWVVVAMVIYLFAFFTVIKGKIASAKTIQLTRDGYVHYWVYIVNWTTILVPCTCAYLLLEKIKESVANNTHESEFFIAIVIVCVSIGYLCLIKDSKSKEKIATSSK